GERRPASATPGAWPSSTLTLDIAGKVEANLAMGPAEQDPDELPRGQPAAGVVQLGERMDQHVGIDEPGAAALGKSHDGHRLLRGQGCAPVSAWRPRVSSAPGPCAPRRSPR